MPSSQITALRIIPTPQQSTATGESFKLTSRTRIVLDKRSSAGDRFAAQQLNGWLLEQLCDNENFQRFGVVSFATSAGGMEIGEV